MAATSSSRGLLRVACAPEFICRDSYGDRTSAAERDSPNLFNQIDAVAQKPGCPRVRYAKKEPRPHSRARLLGPGLRLAGRLLLCEVPELVEAFGSALAQHVSRLTPGLGCQHRDFSSITDALFEHLF